VSKLDCLEDFVVCPETDAFIPLFLKKRKQEQSKESIINGLLFDKKFSLWNITKNELDNLIIDNLFLSFTNILEHYAYKHKSLAKVVVYKAVELYNYFEDIYSEAKRHTLEIELISLVRDPRAVFSSQRQTYMEDLKKYMNKNPIRTANKWSSFINNSVKANRKKIAAIIKYEEFIENPVQELYKISKADFINYDFLDDPDNNFYKKIPGHQKHMHTNILKTIDKTRIKAWKSELDIYSIKLIEKHAGINLLKKMEYEIYKMRFKKNYFLLKEIYWKLDLLLFMIKRILLIFSGRKDLIKNL